VHESTRGWDGVGIMIAGTGWGWEFFGKKFSGVGMGFGINCAGTGGDGDHLVTLCRPLRQTDRR